MAIPLIAIAAGAALAGGVGSAIAGKAGVGKNTYRASNFRDTPNYDANRFEYGGRAGGAKGASDYYNALAMHAYNRQGAQADYRQADADRYQAGQARGLQGQAANLMMRRAEGLVPSIAGQQAAIDMQRAQAAQASMAASARGPAGLALAQQQAANNTANAQGLISGQAQVNAANERLAAEQAAFGAASGMRGLDYQSQAQAAQQAQYNASLQAQQRAQNDQYVTGLLGLQHDVNRQQLQANMAQQGLLASQHTSAQGINSGINAQNAEREMGFFKAGLGAVQGAAQMGAMGTGGGGGGGAAPAGRADGGPVEPGTPYIVGERGPELIVPREAGLVIPNEALPLYEPEGMRLQQGLDGRAYYASEAADSGGRPSLTARFPSRARTPDASGLRMDAPAKAKPRKMTPEELRRAADAMGLMMRQEHDARMAAGPAARVSDGAGAPPGWLDAYMASQATGRVAA